MASQSVSPAPTAQVVAHAFVEQYYLILHRSPESVYKFYQDSSVISRPEPNGVMTSVTTMQAINERILSLDYKNFKAEINTADAQESHMGGVIVLVTGCLTGMDNARRPFAQSFFLAPQEKGYFVLNDVFRYMDESESMETSYTVASGVTDNALKAPTPDPEPAPSLVHHSMDPTTSLPEEYLKNDVEICDPSDNEECSVEEEDVDTADHSSQNEVQQLTSTFSVQEDTPKSYASIVKVMKSTTRSAVHVPTTIVRVAPEKPKQESLVSPAHAPEVETPSTGSSGGHENCIHHEEAESCSIYIRGLPFNAVVAQVEEEFKKFGPIVPDGVQVRSNRQQGFCFGFVEFVSSSSMHNAIEASPVMIGGRKAVVEEKRNTSFRANGAGRGGRFPLGRGGFRNDNFRGRGNFGNRGYGGSDFGARGDFLGRGRGSGRGSEGYQRVYQNTNGRVNSSAAMNQKTASA